jgi:division protein CdvB (Snf7/Vps24/ESCRT-III family)
MKANELAEIAQIAKENMTMKNIKEKSEYDWLNEVSTGSHKKVDSIIEQLKELASKGFGSVEIKLDKTTDMFMVKESENRFYSEIEVCSILHGKGFILEPLNDYYDAQSYLLVWHKEFVEYPIAIGMNI